MDVVRMNSAHLNEEGFLNIINNVRAVSNCRIALLVDTKGPEIRTTVANAPIELKTGERIIVKGDPKGISSHECHLCFVSRHCKRNALRPTFVDRRRGDRPESD